MEKLHIAFTSDTHGHILDEDYATGRHAEMGISRLMDPVHAWCQDTPDSLIVDGGDTMQGTPLMKVWLKGDRTGENPCALALNRLGCQYVTLGNHDFNFGRDVLAQFLQELDATCVCANVHDEKGELPILPSSIATLPSGLVLGITGIVTDYVNIWERPEHLEGIRIEDPVPAVQREAARLREEDVDLVICIYHGGFEEDLATGKRLSKTRENAACEIARTADIDLLLTGHQHMAVDGVKIAGTWCVQPPANALSFVALEGTEERSGWTWTSQLHPADGAPDVALGEALAPLAARTETWLGEPVGTLAAPIAPEEKLSCALSGSAVAHLINEAQLEASGADISCTALPNGATGLGAKVCERDICAVYPFANLLMKAEITRDVLKASLERSASYLELGEDGSPRISDLFLRPKVEHYNFDLYEGIHAVADLRRPVGERIVELTMADGSSVPATLTLACNDYRSTGTGGYEALGECKSEPVGSDEVPDIMAAFLKHRSPYVPKRTRSLEFIWHD
ncbi:MAG: bifunctional metallophosphatase/5'-nucleotidase [Atopobiaceae bacterium]